MTFACSRPFPQHQANNPHSKQFCNDLPLGDRSSTHRLNDFPPFIIPEGEFAIAPSVPRPPHHISSAFVIADAIEPCTPTMNPLSPYSRRPWPKAQGPIAPQPGANHAKLCVCNPLLRRLDGAAHPPHREESGEPDREVSTAHRISISRAAQQRLLYFAKKPLFRDFPFPVFISCFRFCPQH